MRVLSLEDRTFIADPKVMSFTAAHSLKDSLLCPQNEVDEATITHWHQEYQQDHVRQATR
jgi:hypothetical protein